jgi:Mn2+/Fe2+ NRAMP family transporter
VLFVADVDWGEVLRHTVVPQVHFDATFLALMVAVLGATLPPYVFFWQNVHRLEELRDEPAGGDDPVPLRRRARSDAITKKRTSAIDVICGMAFAVAVMFAVIVAVAITVQAGGPSTIASAADAAKALEPVAGGMAKVLFAIGFISAGILAIPVLAGSGAANVSGILGRDWGFSRSVEQAPVFYALVLGGTALGTLLGLTGIQPIRLLVDAATMNGITAAPLLMVVMVVSGDRAVVGAHRAGSLLRALGWAAVGVMGAATAALLLSAASTSSLS